MQLERAALERELARDDHLAACAATACRVLVERGHHLVSVYFERSGLLRCFAAHGYVQVHDGFPLVEGVIGATVATGDLHVENTVDNERYIEAAPGVVAEVCAPITVDGRPVGAINLESTTPLGPTAVAEVALVADVLSERVSELRSQLGLSGWRLVADYATRVVRMTDRTCVAHETLRVARALSGDGTAAIAFGRSATGYTLAFVAGPLADDVRHLTGPSLERIGLWVERARSTYTIGQPDGTGFTGEDTLRAGGVNSLGVFALATGDAHLGCLMTLGTRSSAPSHEAVEQVELVANLAAAALAGVDRVEQLTEQSRRDPLTGLGHSRAFGERLSDVQATESSLHAVLSIDLDHFKRINDSHGHAAGDRVLKAVADAFAAAMREEDCVFRTGGDEFAAIVAVDSPSNAVAVAERLRDAALSVGVDVSIGVALTDPNIDDGESVFSRADAALYRVKRSGRGSVHLSADMPTRLPS